MEMGDGSLLRALYHLFQRTSIPFLDLQLNFCPLFHPVNSFFSHLLDQLLIFSLQPHPRPSAITVLQGKREQTVASPINILIPNKPSNDARLNTHNTYNAMGQFDWFRRIGATPQAVSVLNDQPYLFTILVVVLVILILQGVFLWYIHWATLKPEQKKKKVKGEKGGK